MEIVSALLQACRCALPASPTATTRVTTSRDSSRARAEPAIVGTWTCSGLKGWWFSFSFPGFLSVSVSVTSSETVRGSWGSLISCTYTLYDLTSAPYTIIFEQFTIFTLLPGCLKVCRVERDICFLFSNLRASLIISFFFFQLLQKPRTEREDARPSITDYCLASWICDHQAPHATFPEIPRMGEWYELFV